MYRCVNLIFSGEGMGAHGDRRTIHLELHLLCLTRSSGEAVGVWKFRKYTLHTPILALARIDFNSDGLHLG